MPYVLINGKEPENSEEAKGIASPLFYASGNVKKGTLAWKQKGAEPSCIPNRQEAEEFGFEFVGWSNEDGIIWNYDSYAVIEDMILYPVWKDKYGDLYKVKVSEELGICYNIKVSPSASPSPAPSESPSPAPSASPSAAPSASPSAAPSESPSAAPSSSPSALPAGES